MFVPFVRKAKFSSKYFLHPFILSYCPELPHVATPAAREIGRSETRLICHPGGAHVALSKVRVWVARKNR